MKAAIIMAGMLRNFEHTYWTTKEFILEDKSFENVDIFFSGYPSKKGINYCKREFNRVYKPKGMNIVNWNSDIEKEIKTNTNFNKWRKKNYIHRSSNLINTLSSWRNRDIANQLRKKYELENNLKYDVVISLRSDFFCFENIEKSLLEEAISNINNIYIPGMWDFKEIDPIAVGDITAFGSSIAMDKYFSLYAKAKEYNDMNVSSHSETLSGFHIKEMGLNRKFCKRFLAREYPFSDEDINKLWSNKWNKNDLYQLMNITDEETKCSNSHDPLTKEKAIRLIQENKIINIFINIYSIFRAKFIVLKKKNKYSIIDKIKKYINK